MGTQALKERPQKLKPRRSLEKSDQLIALTYESAKNRVMKWPNFSMNIGYRGHELLHK